MLNICRTSALSPKIKDVYIYGCLGSNMGHRKRNSSICLCGSMFFFLVNKFKKLHKGYGLIEHEIFCVVTNEGGALVRVANFTIVVNTNICS